MATPTISPAKICTKCGLQLPATVEYFHKHRGGLRPDCKVCKAASMREYRRDHPEQVSARERQRYLRHLEKRREKDRRYHAEHRSVRRQRHAEWRSLHLEERRIAIRAWQQSHPEQVRILTSRHRATKRGLPNSFTAVDWQACLGHFARSCAACGSSAALQADHWIPLSSPRCPGTVVSNMIPLCRKCNISKRDRDGQEWLKQKLGVVAASAMLQRIEAYLDGRLL